MPGLFKHPFFSCAVIILTGIFLLSYTFDRKLDLNGDNVSYLLLGRALASGQGYVNLGSADKSPHMLYPPGYPALIALLTPFAGSSPEGQAFPAKVFNGLLFIAILLLGFAVFKQVSGSTGLSLTAVLLLALNAHLLRFASILMTEIPFLFSVFSVFFLLSKTDLEKGPLRDVRFQLGLLGAVAAFYIRPQGITLGAAIIIYLLFARKWRYFAAAAAVIPAGILPWFIRGRLHGQSPHLSQLFMVNPYEIESGLAGPAELLKRVLSNAGRYMNIEIPHALFPGIKLVPGQGPGPLTLFSALLLAAAVFGLVKMKRQMPLWAGFIGSVLGVCLLWPGAWFGPRFMLGIIPLLVFLILFGLHSAMLQILTRLRQERKWNPLFLLILGIASIEPLKALHHHAEAPYPPGWVNYFKTAEWVKAKIPAGTVISCRKPNFFYLFSGRPTTAYLFTWDRSAVLSGLLNNDVEFVVLESLGYSTTPAYLLPAMRQISRAFTPVLHLKDPDTYIFRVTAPRTPAGRAEVVAASMNIHAFTLISRRQPDSALSRTRESIELLRKNGLYESAELGNAYDNMGSILFEKDENLLAADYWKQAVKIFVKTIGPEDPKTAAVMTNRGIALDYAGHPDEAVTVLRQALELRERVLEPGHFDLAHSHYNLGNRYRHQLKFKDAEFHLRRAVAILEQHSPQALDKLKAAVMELAAVCLQDGREQDARSVFDDYLAHLGEKIGKTNPQLEKEAAYAEQFLKHKPDPESASRPGGILEPTFRR